MNITMAIPKQLCAKALATAVLIALPAASSAAPLRFTTAVSAQTACDYPAIHFGPALAPFALLSATTITNTGNSIVSNSAAHDSDDLIGVWPGSSVTGFYPPGLDSGGPRAIYAAAYNTNRTVPMNAQTRLKTVYKDVAAQAPTMLVSGDLSQVSVPGYPVGSLPPGVYRSTSTLGIMAGNLTLVQSHTGLPSVFVFQVATSFTTTASGPVGGNVILGKGIDACNVVWQVGDNATLAGASFVGSLLSYSAITIEGASMVGRALSLNGAVTVTASGGTHITNPGGG
jgi:hypothetical protein